MLRMFPTKRSTRRLLSPGRGYRVVVPHVRGHGSTRVLSGETFRNGQQSVVALDIIADNYGWRQASLKASRNMTIWKSDLPKARSSPTLEAEANGAPQPGASA
jgi:hypothetical protein